MSSLYFVVSFSVCLLVFARQYFHVTAIIPLFILLLIPVVKECPYQIINCLILLLSGVAALIFYRVYFLLFFPFPLMFFLLQAVDKEGECAVLDQISQVICALFLTYCLISGFASIRIIRPQWIGHQIVVFEGLLFSIVFFNVALLTIRMGSAKKEKIMTRFRVFFVYLFPALVALELQILSIVFDYLYFEFYQVFFSPFTILISWLGFYFFCALNKKSAISVLLERIKNWGRLRIKL